MSRSSLTRIAGRELRAVVFDLDDTLYLEQDYVLSGFRAVAGWAERRWLIPADDTYQELRRLFREGVRGDTFDCWLRGRGMWRKRTVQQMVKVYRGHNPQIRPSTGVPLLLVTLGRQYRLGLVSDGPPQAQQRKLAALGLADRFHAIVWSDELGLKARKPSPRPFKKVLGDLAVSADEAVYVGDNPDKDFLGARRIGMATVRIRHPEGLYSSREPATPDHASHVEITSVSALSDLLPRIRRTRPAGKGHKSGR